MRARWLTAAVVAALVVLAAPAGAMAQDYTVNSELDTLPNGCTGDPGGCTLRERSTPRRWTRRSPYRPATTGSRGGA